MILMLLVILIGTTNMDEGTTHNSGTISSGEETKVDIHSKINYTSKLSKENNNLRKDLTPLWSKYSNS